MTDISMPVENEDYSERSVMRERRTIHDRRIAEKKLKASIAANNVRPGLRKYNLALDFLGSVIAVVISIIVLVSTGLFNGASSTFVQIILIAAVVCAFVVAFRRAFYA